MVVRLPIVVILVGGMGLVSPCFAQRPEPEVVATIDGEDVMKLLPIGGIPAIDEPEFVSGEGAEAQMKDDEPVLGVVVEGEAKAYSLWQLDAHEIVNDTVGGRALAATW